jgi:hypothetical protein
MTPRTKRRCLLAAALTSLTFGCGSDPRERANELIAEINIRSAASTGLAKQALLAEEKLDAEYMTMERGDVKTLAQTEAAILKEAASMLREAADKADECGKLDINEVNTDFMSAKARLFRKGAEIYDARRERAEVLTTDLPPGEVSKKRVELGLMIVHLSMELRALHAEVMKLEPAYNADKQK